MSSSESHRSDHALTWFQINWRENSAIKLIGPYAVSPAKDEATRKDRALLHKNLEALCEGHDVSFATIYLAWTKAKQWSGRASVPVLRRDGTILFTMTCSFGFNKDAADAVKALSGETKLKLYTVSERLVSYFYPDITPQDGWTKAIGRMYIQNRFDFPFAETTESFMSLADAKMHAEETLGKRNEEEGKSWPLDDNFIKGMSVGAVLAGKHVPFVKRLVVLKEVVISGTQRETLE